MKRPQISISLSTITLSELKALAAKFEMPVADVVRRIVERDIRENGGAEERKRAP